MVDDSVPEIPAIPIPRLAIGEQLRAGRQAKGIELAEAAHQLNLDTRALDALEQERFGDLGDSVFAKGHLRSYARLLDIDPKPLLEAFDRQVGGMPPPLKKVVRIENGPSLQTSWLPAALARGTFIAVLLLVGVWVLKTGWDMINGRLEVADINDSAELILPPPPLGSGADRDVINVPLPEPSMTPHVTNPIPISPPAPAATVAAATDVSITLRFSADVWVEIYDKNEKRLFTRVGKTGESVTLSGPGPLSVVIGNAQGVVIEYQGQAYDFKRHVKGQVARFKLGGPK